jgi:hypothetical protein
VRDAHVYLFASRTALIPCVYSQWHHPRTMADAIREVAHSPALLAKLGEVDAQIAAVDRRIEQRPMNLAGTVTEMREFVFKNVMKLQTLLRNDASKSKAALARHIGQLTLTPRETPKGPVYEVNGALDVLDDENDVVPLVARDGIGLWPAVDCS